MSLMFEFPNFVIHKDGADDDVVLCEIDLDIVDYGSAPALASLNYPGDPGEPPTYEVEEIRLTYVFEDERGISLTLNETQFETFFSGGSDVLTNAYEWASEQEIERDDY